MKIQIDTNTKTIKVEENIKFSELISGLKKLFPNGEWKDYTLESNSIIYWSTYPVITYNDTTKPWWQQQPYYYGGDINCDFRSISDINVGTNGKAEDISGSFTHINFDYASTDGSMVVNQTMRDDNHADGEENQGIPNGIFNVEL